MDIKIWKGYESVIEFGKIQRGDVFSTNRVQDKVPNNLHRPPYFLKIADTGDNECNALGLQQFDLVRFENYQLVHVVKKATLEIDP